MLVLACVVVALVVAVMIRRWWTMSRSEAPAEPSDSGAGRASSSSPARPAPPMQAAPPQHAAPPVQAAPPSGASVPARRSTTGQGDVVLSPPNAADVTGGDAAWSEARRLRASLLASEVPSTIAAWEIVPEPGEVFFYDLKAVHERFYGQDVAFRPAGSFLLGNPAFILAGLVVTGAVNASRQRAAEAQAATQWRDREGIRVLVTNHRLLCLVHGQWLSFHYKAMTAVYPEVAERTLVCGFESIAPLRLSGIDAPILAVMTIFMTHGADALAQHPALRPLD